MNCSGVIKLEDVNYMLVFHLWSEDLCAPLTLKRAMRHRQVHGLIINVAGVIKLEDVNYMLGCNLRSKDLCAPLIDLDDEG